MSNGEGLPAAGTTPLNVKVSKIKSGLLPARTRVYAIGDIHGRADLLSALLQAIAADNANREPAASLLVFLGDYVDRGPSSKEVVERLSGDPLPGFTAHYLKGNHEELLMLFLQEPGGSKHWLKQGGAATLASYGVDENIIKRASNGDAGAISLASEAFAAALPSSHLAFFNSLKTRFPCGTYFFAHAGVRPGVPLDRQTDDDLIWIRDPFLKHDGDFGAVVVHGHSPTPKPEDLKNRIGVDTQAWKTGVLTAAGFEADLRWFLSTKEITP